MSTVEAKKEHMLEAIRQAKQAEKEGDYAVGAVLTKGSKIIASCGNRSKRDESPIAHAEVLAIVQACQLFKSRHLAACILYVTHEPCPMCSSVAVWAKLKGIVYGARIEDMRNYRQSNGNDKWLWRTIEIPCEEIIAKSTEKIEIIKDFMRDECISLFHN
ncbi:MAG TPA: nucleoside deaminase [Candidatus Paceibacterota bacterium]